MRINAIRKIALDARPLENPINGIGRYFREILRQIVEQTDWELILLTTRPLADNQFDPDRVTVLQTGKIAGSTFVGFQLRAAKLVSDLNIDLYFSPRHHLPWGLKCPQIVTVHDLAWVDVPSTMKFPGAWIERLLMPRAIRSADAVIAVSKFTAETIGKKFPRYQKKVQVIYQSSFLEVGGSGDCESKLFLSVGTHEPRKNYDRLLRAFAIVLKDHPEVRLVIVGKHGWKIDLQSLVHRYGLSEQVTLDTGADDKRLAQLYRECQALIMPSLYEGFGLPLVEALHFGKPIITSNCSAMPEVAADAAYLVDPMDTQDIARGISRVLEDDSLRRGLAAASQQRAKFFSWHTAGINTVALFEKVVSSERVC